MNPIIRTVGKLGEAVLCRLFTMLPKSKTIIFESNPDYGCNTYPVFLQMKKELPDYKMVWCTEPSSGMVDGVADTFRYESLRIGARTKSLYYLCTASAIITSNRELKKKRKDQMYLFLCHGSKTKKTRGVYGAGEGVDYVNVQSHFFDDIITYEYSCEKEKLVYLGYPRCDCFFDKEDPAPMVRQKLNMESDARYLVWLPTFRKHTYTGLARKMDCTKYEKIGMPLVYSLEDLQKLNSFLSEKNIYLVFKPHPRQDISSLKAAELSHVRIISDKYLARQDMQLYTVLAGSDGLITDYSSVFFDYLLLDKPIVTTVDDAQEWKQMTGFAFDLDAFLDKATTRAATLEELLAFLADMDTESAAKAEGRREIRELTNMWQDGNSTKRVVQFVREKIGE